MLHFKKNLFSVFGSLVLLFTLYPVVQAEEGPKINFEEEQKTSPSSPYGEKDLLKFGSQKNYFKLGGYGSMRFAANTAEDVHHTFTLRRFVLTTDALMGGKFRIYSELEFERFRKIELERTVVAQDGGLTVKQEIEGTHKSEIAFEQIWFELAFADYIRLKGGGVLIPVGRFNINHDDNAWNLPRRPLLDRGVPVLPVAGAWDELGFGLNGDIELGEKSKLKYQIFVVNGATLDAEVEEVIKTRDPKRDELEVEAEFGISTGTFSQDIKDAKALTGRLAYSPVLGHEIGFSAYYGRYTPSFLIDRKVSVFAFDWLSTFGGFAIEAEYAMTHFDGLGSVLGDFASVVGNNEAEVSSADSPDLETKIKFKPSKLADTKHGYWIELRYAFRPAWLTGSWFGKHFSDPQLIPVIRWEQAFVRGLVTDFEALDGAVTSLVKENRRVDRITAGLAFRLNPLAVFHLAYEYTRTNDGKSLASVTRFLPTESDQNHAVMFGTAFGF